MANIEVRMPLMGEGVNEAQVTKWLVQPGGNVEKDAPLVEVSTDKVDTEIMSPESGVLQSVLVNEGDTIIVDQVIATIASDAEEPDADSQETSAPSKPEPENTSSLKDRPTVSTSTSASSADHTDELIRSSPLVRKMAKDMNIDLRDVDGSGLHGRITKKDILAFAENKNQAAAATPTTPTPVERAPSALTESAPNRLQTSISPEGVETLEGVAVERQSMSRMRQLIAKHMVDSVRTSPHVTTVFEIDMHKVVSSRESHKAAFQKQEGFKLTFTPYLIYAAVQAIKTHPIVNTSLDGQDILFKKDINIGCAVAIDGGLIVPVIKQAQDLNLAGIARRLNDLIVRARSGKLKPDDVSGGTFTITNPGGYGSLTSNPIINQPQVAILGVGAIVKRPVVVDDMIGIRPQMLASLTFDHRVIDGEGGAKYLASFRDYLEAFSESPL